MSEYLVAHIGHTCNHHEHILLWRPNERGYTVGIQSAGLYSKEEAQAICKYGSCIAFKKTDMQEFGITQSTPYFRRDDGSLRRLYDGGDHVVMPNTKEVWAVLMKLRLDCGKTDKPTPIGKKARAIYLPSQA